MPHITVDDQQARMIAESGGAIEIRDRQGRCLGYVSHGFTSDEIAEAQRRRVSNEPRYTMQQVQEHISRSHAPRGNDGLATLRVAR